MLKENSEQKSRIAQLRAKLKTEPKRYVFEISQKGQEFLDFVNKNLNNPNSLAYSRGGKSGQGFVGVASVVEAVSDQYYSDDEKQKLLDNAADIRDRMRVKISAAYLRHAMNVPKGAKYPHPILKVVMPDIGEIEDLSGEVDPSNQNRYSPLDGLLHKYGMVLAYTSINCSSHCRYCYRLDLFNGSSGKTKADMRLVAAYIKTFNSLIDEAIKNYGVFDEANGLFVDVVTKEPLTHIREMLFSGGDPMTLPNSTLARYMVLMAEAGIEVIRIGTKDLVFHPQRFDEDFWQMMDSFRKQYPKMQVDIVGHYVHPFELFEPRIDSSGNYVYDTHLEYKVREDVSLVLEEMRKRGGWINHYNQFPIIAGVNDAPQIIRLLLYQGRRLGIQIHNVYACREIVGNKHFRANNDIISQYYLLEHSKTNLSGLENRAKLVMSTEYGKFEVIGFDGVRLFLKLNRFVNESFPQNTIIAVDTSKLPDGQKFYWLTEEVIELAVSPKDKETLTEISARDQSFVSRLKTIAARRVKVEAEELEDFSKKSPAHRDDKLQIEVVGTKGSEIFEFKLDEKTTLQTKSSDQDQPLENKPSNNPKLAKSLAPTTLVESGKIR